MDKEIWIKKYLEILVVTILRVLVSFKKFGLSLKSPRKVNYNVKDYRRKPKKKLPLAKKTN